MSSTVVRADLPSSVTAYLDAHAVRAADAALPLFVDDAEVTDEGKTYRGKAEIREWIGSAASEYTYTTTETEYARPGPNHVQVFARFEGNFPGGAADVVYDFRLRDGLISSLTIE